MLAHTRRIMMLLAAMAVAMATTAAHADDYECHGLCVFGPDASFENLIIKEGATAILNGSRVDGNIFVRDGATLKAKHISVGGNIQSTGAKKVCVVHSSIGGDFQMDNTGPIDLRCSTVGGNVQLFSNNAGSKGMIRIVRNNVEGNIQANSNRSKRFCVSFNIIDGNLQGESNNAAPVGVGNIVQGDTDEQFENF